MSLFICPVCGGKLHIEERSYACEKGHRFDMAKQGYVNLLMNGASSQKRHGDDKRMIRARRDFLNAGFYAPLLESAKELLSLYIKEENSVLDIGCGEAYYTAGLAEAFPKMRFAGIDISKDALIYAKKRMPSLEAAVASGIEVNLCHCDSCSFSFYDKRLTSNEESKLYSGYRENDYQKLREKYEPWYTEKINQAMNTDKVALQEQQRVILKMMRKFINKPLKTGLDFGGNRGDTFCKDFEIEKQYVYDISGVETVPGVSGISSFEELKL